MGKQQKAVNIRSNQGIGLPVKTTPTRSLQTEFIAAVKQSNLDEVNKLLKEHPHLITIMPDGSNKNCLVYFLRNSQLEAVKMILENHGAILLDYFLTDELLRCGLLMPVPLPRAIQTFKYFYKTLYKHNPEVFTLGLVGLLAKSCRGLLINQCLYHLLCQCIDEIAATLMTEGKTEKANYLLSQKSIPIKAFLSKGAKSKADLHLLLTANQWFYHKYKVLDCPQIGIIPPNAGALEFYALAKKKIKENKPQHLFAWIRTLNPLIDWKHAISMNKVKPTREDEKSYQWIFYFSLLINALSKHCWYAVVDLMWLCSRISFGQFYQCIANRKLSAEAKAFLLNQLPLLIEGADGSIIGGKVLVSFLVVNELREPLEEVVFHAEGGLTEALFSIFSRSNPELNMEEKAIKRGRLSFLSKAKMQSLQSTPESSIKSTLAAVLEHGFPDDLIAFIENFPKVDIDEAMKRLVSQLSETKVINLPKRQRIARFFLVAELYKEKSYCCPDRIAENLMSFSLSNFSLISKNELLCLVNFIIKHPVEFTQYAWHDYLGATFLLPRLSEHPATAAFVEWICISRTQAKHDKLHDQLNISDEVSGDSKVFTDRGKYYLNSFRRVSHCVTITAKEVLANLRALIFAKGDLREVIYYSLVNDRPRKLSAVEKKVLLERFDFSLQQAESTAYQSMSMTLVFADMYSELFFSWLDSHQGTAKENKLKGYLLEQHVLDTLRVSYPELLKKIKQWKENKRERDERFFSEISKEFSNISEKTPCKKNKARRKKKNKKKASKQKVENNSYKASTKKQRRAAAQKKAIRKHQQNLKRAKQLAAENEQKPLTAEESQMAVKALQETLLDRPYEFTHLRLLNTAKACWLALRFGKACTKKFGHSELITYKQFANSLHKVIKHFSDKDPYTALSKAFFLDQALVTQLRAIWARAVLAHLKYLGMCNNSLLASPQAQLLTQSIVLSAQDFPESERSALAITKHLLDCPELNADKCYVSGSTSMAALCRLLIDEKITIESADLDIACQSSSTEKSLHRVKAILGKHGYQNTAYQNKRSSEFLNCKFENTAEETSIDISFYREDRGSAKDLQQRVTPWAAMLMKLNTGELVTSASYLVDAFSFDKTGKISLLFGLTTQKPQQLSLLHSQVNGKQLLLLKTFVKFYPLFEKAGRFACGMTSLLCLSSIVKKVNALAGNDVPAFLCDKNSLMAKRVKSYREITSRIRESFWKNKESIASTGCIPSKHLAKCALQ